MVDKIKYVCKNCGWTKSIRVEWGDLKPKRCTNKKCNTSFLASPDSLVIHRPEKKKKVEPEKVYNLSKKATKKKTSKKESLSNGKASNQG